MIASLPSRRFERRGAIAFWGGDERGPTVKSLSYFGRISTQNDNEFTESEKISG
jgi:hypothetical protein